MNWWHALTFIFVIAKLADVITWSWWLVLAPSIAVIGLALLILAGTLAGLWWINRK